MNQVTKPKRNKNPFLRLFFAAWYIVAVASSYYVANEFLGPKIESLLRNSEDAVEVINNTSAVVKQNVNKGLRSAKLYSGFEELPKVIVNETTYKDVRLISTPQRPFSDKEISILKIIIDFIPQKLFDYRPWAIISTKFEGEDFVSKVNPEGVAFTSGPYVFVSDVTFTKVDGFDTGTFRGLLRVMSHEFTHTAQFFETQKIPNSYINSYLESSDIVKDWISKMGWKLENDKWMLSSNELSTEYGKSTPVEDMADAVGSMIIGDEYSISKSRADWILAWLGIDKETLFKGTIPLSSTIKQRRIEANDLKLLAKYKDDSALQQDAINFQSTEITPVKDLVKFYGNEFKKRGWNGVINANGTGELVYQNKLKINMEMDKNPMRVVTIVMSVY